MTRAPQVHLVRRGTRRLRVLEWPGPGPALMLLHPNGLGAGVFAPLASALCNDFRCLAVDLAAHGGSDAPATRQGFAFAALADDVVFTLETLGIEHIQCVGGSLGGGVGILVDRARPGLIERIVLCEAVAFDLGAGPAGENPMAAAARKRRRHWASVEAMRNAYSQRPPLSELAPEALDGYLAWGTVTDGQGVSLACAPEHEATIFEISAEPQGAADAWGHLPALSCDAVVLSGDRSFLPDGMCAAQAARAGCAHRVVPGGHFFVHEDTARGATLVREELGSVPS